MKFFIYDFFSKTTDIVTFLNGKLHFCEVLTATSEFSKLYACRVTQLMFTCSKSTIETSEKGVKNV